MRRPPVKLLVNVALLGVAGACVGLAMAGGTAAAPPALYPVPAKTFTTAVNDDDVLRGPGAQIGVRRMRAAGASVVRMVVAWDKIAPANPPRGFDARNPGSPGYDWRETDRQVRLVVNAGMKPLLTVTGAPVWAAPARRERPQDGPTRPDVKEFGDFATAIATRYSGSYHGLPRVRYWEAWNEPNVSVYLMPQIDGGEVVSPDTYRGLLNAFYAAVHRVRSDNVVAAGGLSPFTVRNPAVETIGPLAFLRDLLCLSSGPSPRATCNDVVHFDAWSVHPYTSGGPTHHALNPDDLSMGDLSKVRPLLQAAIAAGHVRSSGPIRYWVTEFSWDTSPPDPQAVPVDVQARWTSDALYRMWQNGVQLATWFTLRDNPPSADVQSGLYFRSKSIATDRPKLTLRAFRFPFVVHRSGRGLLFWGRSPDSRSVTVEQRRGGGWHVVARATAGPDGVFHGTLGGRNGSYRARTAGDMSLPFSVVGIDDLKVTPFGVGSIK